MVDSEEGSKHADTLDRSEAIFQRSCCTQADLVVSVHLPWFPISSRVFATITVIARVGGVQVKKKGRDFALGRTADSAQDFLCDSRRHDICQWSLFSVRQWFGFVRGTYFKAINAIIRALRSASPLTYASSALRYGKAESLMARA